MRLYRGSEQTKLARLVDGLDPAVNIQLGVDVLGVGLEGAVYYPYLLDGVERG